MLRRSLSSFVLVISVLISSSVAMAEVSGDGDSSSSAAVHIIYTEKPLNEEPEAFHLRTLSSVLGRSVWFPRKTPNFAFFNFLPPSFSHRPNWFLILIAPKFSMVIARRLPRRLSYTVTRTPLVDSPPSWHPSRFRKSQVSVLCCYWLWNCSIRLDSWMI